MGELFNREFIVALVLLVAATVLAAIGALPQERWEQWVDFAKWIGGAFIVSRGLAKFGQVDATTKTKKGSKSL